MHDMEIKVRVDKDHRSEPSNSDNYLIVVNLRRLPKQTQEGLGLSNIMYMKKNKKHSITYNLDVGRCKGLLINGLDVRTLVL